MTYQDVLNKLQAMTPEQLQMTATVMDENTEECYAISSMQVSDESIDILDPGHPVFVSLL
jgi:hypothetical protein